MFDRTDPADLAALKAEYTNDPLPMNYANAAGTREILRLLNDPQANVGNQTRVPVLTAPLLLNVVDPADLNTMDAGGRAFLSMLVQYGSTGEGQDIDAFKLKVRSLFPPGTATRTAMNALSKRASRAEVLFGDGTIIDRQDLIAARDS